MLGKPPRRYEGQTSPASLSPWDGGARGQDVDAASLTGPRSAQKLIGCGTITRMAGWAGSVSTDVSSRFTFLREFLVFQLAIHDTA